MDDQDITKLRQIVHTTSCVGIKIDTTRGDGPTLIQSGHAAGCYSAYFTTKKTDYRGKLGYQ